MTPQERAERSAREMWSDDGASQWFGMTLAHVGPGTATVTMTVEKHHCNGHGSTHGGVTFSLADTAFAFACNSYNTTVVAQHNSITYLAPGRVGDRLTAIAREVSRAGRSGIYDVEVANQDGQVLAQFRGHSRQVPGQHFEE